METTYGTLLGKYNEICLDGKEINIYDRIYFIFQVTKFYVKKNLDLCSYLIFIMYNIFLKNT